jgi:predicted  nucleic acid-binding Zn-ribbon protein
MKRPLDTVIELQEALAQLRRAETQLGGIPDWMKELDAEYQEHKTEIDELEHEAESGRMERRTAEAGISDAQEKLRRYQRQINEVTTQREYGALLQEIDTVKSQISSFEEQGLAAMERVEASTQALEERRAAFQELEDRYQTELERWEQEKPELAREAEILRERVAGLRQDVPRPQLAQFERILERTNGQALAPIRRMDRGRGPSMWHCGACNYNVRPQVLVEIKDRGSLIQCDSCKRILYVQEERAVEEVEA